MWQDSNKKNAVCLSLVTNDNFSNSVCNIATAETNALKEEEKKLFQNMSNATDEIHRHTLNGATCNMLLRILQLKCCVPSVTECQITQWHSDSLKPNEFQWHGVFFFSNSFISRGSMKYGYDKDKKRHIWIKEYCINSKILIAPIFLNRCSTPWFRYDVFFSNSNSRQEWFPIEIGMENTCQRGENEKDLGQGSWYSKIASLINVLTQQIK